MANLREKTVKGVIWSAIQHTLNPLISFVVFLVLARLVEPAAFGLLALAVAIVNFIQMFLSGGFGSAIVQRESLEPEHLDTAFWANMVMAVVLMAMIIGLSGLISGIFTEPGLKPIIQWLSIMLLIDAMTQVQIAQLRRNMAFRSLAIRTMVSEPIGGTVGITMALAGFGVWSLVARYLTSSLCRLFVLWLASDWRPGFQISRKHFDDLFSFGANMVGTNFVTFFSRRSDTFLIGYFLGSTELGYYNVGYRLFHMMTEIIGGTINNVAWPLFSRLQNDLPRLRETFYTTTRLVSLLAFPVFLGILATAPRLVPTVFGEKWIPSIPVMQILTFIGLLQSLFFFNESVIVSVGKPQWRLFLQIALGVTNVAAFFLVVRWGIASVATVYVIIGYMFAPLSLWMVKRLIGIKFWLYLRQYGVPLLASGVMLITVFSVERWFSPAWLSQARNGETWFLGILIVSCALTYFLTVYWLSPSTVALIKALVKDLRPKTSRPARPMKIGQPEDKN